jgi:hypothetical protein
MTSRGERSPILVVYYAREFPLRATIFDHLYSFRRYAGRPCFYLNLAERRPARHLLRVRFDMVVFHTTFLSQRWDGAHFQRLVDKAQMLREFSGVKIALPQDEFLQTDALADFLRSFDVTHVFSVMPEAAWPSIYPTVDRSRVQFSRVLTGYLETETLARIERLSASVPRRDIDIGYRAWRAAPWLGRHGMLKHDLADVFGRRTPEAGLRMDISTRDEDVLLGDTWYAFLLRCKYTLGVEGGASILDRNGEVRRRTEAFMQQNPKARFAEIERACFSGLDGTVHLVAISPRHLEACATRTCQILVEGEYNGILNSEVHYVELKRDFSNAEAVFDLIRQDTARAEMTDRAYRDIVTSGAHTYQRFVQFVMECALGAGTSSTSGAETRTARLVCTMETVADRVSWARIAIRIRWIALIQSLPPHVRSFLRRLRTILRATMHGFRSS